MAARRFRDEEGTRLAERFRAGDEDAFQELYRCYFDAVHTYLEVVLKNSADAEDTAQLVFLKALRALPSYEPRGVPFGRWLFAIARNAAYDFLRRPHTQTTDPDVITIIADHATHGRRGPATTGDFDLMQLVDALPTPQREVILLKFFFGFRNDEIAAIMERTDSSVDGLIYRAMLTLEHALHAAGHPKAAGGVRRRSRPPRPLPVAA